MNPQFLHRLRMTAWVLSIGAGALTIAAFWAYEARGIGAAGGVLLLVAVLVWQAWRLRRIADKLEAVAPREGAESK